MKSTAVQSQFEYKNTGFTAFGNQRMLNLFKDWLN